MQEIELSPKKKFKLKYEGVVHELRRPTLGELRQFQELTKSVADQGEMLDSILKYLASLGLPKEVAEQFDPDQLEELISTLSAKKN